MIVVRAFHCEKKRLCNRGRNQVFFNLEIIKTVPSVVKSVAKEGGTKEGSKQNTKRLKHGHIMWPFLLHAPYLHSISNQTAKSSLQRFSPKINGLVSTYVTTNLSYQYHQHQLIP